MAGDGLEPAARQQRAQPLGERAELRRARGPLATATWRRMSVNARFVSNRLTVAAGTGANGPVARGEDALSADPPPPTSGNPLTASTTKPTPIASCTISATTRTGPTARCCAQSLAVTASRMSANRRRASSRRVGTCSVGTASGGAW